MQWRLLKGLIVNVNGAVLSLRRFLAFETPLKTMKNDLNFTLKAHFVLKIYKFLSWLFGHVEKRLDQKNKVNFKIYDVMSWLFLHTQNVVEKLFPDPFLKN